MQFANETIDVANWSKDEEFPTYPEGAREKTLLYCPSSPPYNFLKPNHRYLFKKSSHRYQEQYWTEIFAYQLGVKMEINIPATFVAYDSKEKQSGALIEWFLYRTASHGHEEYTPGGDFFQEYIPDFDRKEGKQHNFETLEKIFIDLGNKHPNIYFEWKKYWTTTFTFDALIGNTDRHQDNWGVITNPIDGEKRISPVFDNGTSLGHEIFPNKFELFNDNNYLEKYVLKGHHHIKWTKNDSSSADHLELLQKMIKVYPEIREWVLDCLKKVNNETFEGILNNLIKFDVPIKLSLKRANFMLKLLQFRHQRLLQNIEL